MSLVPGARLGPYEILSALGAGGMGEVYRARDTKLGRDVALKLLPATFTTDAERLARFRREAQVLASLNHPHIGAIYGLDEANGAQFLVLELVDGESLDKRIARGAIPVDEALGIAKQIAEALEAAHEKGIIHRDLKPANIALTKDGHVKVLDFGLAKAMEPAGGSPIDLANSPTITSPAMMTGVGMILGTAAYMSPEQAKGRPADKRSDVWAFGCVLYEMLTGKRAFVGDDVSDTLAAVLRGEPDWAALPTATSLPIRKLLRRCLQKDRKRRLADAADARLEIDDALTAPTGDTDVVRITTQRAGWVRAIPWVVAAAALVLAAALAVPATRYLRRSVLQPPPMRFDITTPPTNDPGSFALSSDGRQLAFVATVDHAPRLLVRSLDQVTAHPLAGTEGASAPFWAPDGTTIGFFADGRLKRIDVGGGAPQVLADAPSGHGGTWNNGVILFAPTSGSPLMRVPATGGTPVAVTRLATLQGSHYWPQFLPDGRRFLFLAATGHPGTRGVYLGALDGGEPSRVLEAETAAVFAPPGALLLVRQSVLVAYRFDPTRGVVDGDPMPVAQGVGTDLMFRGAFAVSATGVLAHRTGGAERRQLVWVDRAGAVLGTIGPADETGLFDPELAPDGRRVAVTRTVEGNRDVWLIEVGRGVASRFTFDANIDRAPLWSPDGRRVVFLSVRNGIADLFEKPTSGGDEQPLLVTAEPKVPLAWSPDGRVLLYGVQNRKTGVEEFWALPLVGERKPFPVMQTRFSKGAAQFSPDGRWVAYQSSESGRVAVYVQPFPGPGEQWQVSTAGGTQPRWRPDGKELFYVAPDDRLMALPIAVGRDRQTLEAGTPVALFPARLASGGGIGSFLSKPQYAVAPDGRFLMNVPADGASASPITLLFNWETSLKR